MNALGRSLGMGVAIGLALGLVAFILAGRAALRSEAVGGHAPVMAEGSVVGNRGTRVYHAATDSRLPRPDRRVYFASAEEAEARGYRRAGRRA